VARHFMSAGVKRMVIANRTLGRAQALAAELKAYATGRVSGAGVSIPILPCLIRIAMSALVTALLIDQPG